MCLCCQVSEILFTLGLRLFLTGLIDSKNDSRLITKFTTTCLSIPSKFSFQSFRLHVVYGIALRSVKKNRYSGFYDPRPVYHRLLAFFDSDAIFFYVAHWIKVVLLTLTL